MPGNVDHRSDLDNMEKTILDAAQGIVYPNDCWIDECIKGRYAWQGEDYITVFEIWEQIPERRVKPPSLPFERKDE